MTADNGKKEVNMRGNPNIVELGKKTRIKTSEQAREMQKKGIEAYHEHKTARELLEAELSKTDKEGITRKQRGMEHLAQEYAKGDLYAIKAGQEILGENVQNINIKGEGFKIEVASEKTAKELSEIVNEND